MVRTLRFAHPTFHPKYASRTSGRLASSCDGPDATTRPFDST
jgi:hypothetical protein